jgi:SAM-dependent methyltransferase
MQTVHHSAADGYTAKASTYVKGRPDYPSEIEGWLRRDIGLSDGKTVLDLGAGTGKFIPKLLATGATVIAVEPVPAMLGQLTRLYPDIEAKEGSAEHIPLADASVDAVVCAQAFHWFATPEALTEINRVLKLGGALGLVWNVRDERVAWVAALTEIMKPFEGDAPRHINRNGGACSPPLDSVPSASSTSRTSTPVLLSRLSLTVSCRLVSSRLSHVANRSASRVMFEG